MKKILLTCASVGAISALCFGQMQQKHEQYKNMTAQQRANNQTELMKERLGLTEDQAKKVDVINAKYAEERVKLHKQGEKNQEAIQNSFKAQKNELKSVLSPAQYEKLEAFYAEKKGDGMQMNGQRLSPEMKEKIKAERIKFDKQLSEDDRKFLAVKSQEIHQGGGHGPGHQHLKEGDEPKLSESDRTRVKSIIDKHKTSLDEIHNRLKKQMPEQAKAEEHTDRRYGRFLLMKIN